MTVGEFAREMGMKVLSGHDRLDRNVTGVYVCDLLSWVMSHANQGDAWITILTNLNIVAVATLTEVACVIIPEGITVEEPVLKRAGMEGVVILSSDKSAYRICCDAHKLVGSLGTGEHR